MARLELKGVSVNPGVGIGTVFVAVEAGGLQIPERKITPSKVAAALAGFEAARLRAIEGLVSIQSATAKELGIQDAAIYGAQIAVLKDPDALQTIRELVRRKHLAPESAIQALLDKFTGLFEGLEGGDIKNWAADLRDPWYAVIRELNRQQEEHEIETAKVGKLIVVAEELTPSLVTRFDLNHVSGFLCARGGRFSHGAVLARSFGVPTVIGVEKVHARARNGEACVLRAGGGHALLGATKIEQAEAQKLAEELERLTHTLEAAAYEPGRTADGTPVEIRANIESPRDLSLFDVQTVAGIGLVRTEFAYMERPTFPSQKEQSEIYRSILEPFANKPVVFRTLDIGGDKPLRYFKQPAERNPALGWRGLRVTLEWQDLFLQQLQALVEARRMGNVQVLLPMVTTLEELRAAREMLEQVCGEDEPGTKLPLGVMIEVPSAAMAVEDLAAEADFIAVGTNDLTQYLFAADRDNPWVSELYQPYHPAHLRLLASIARTCQEVGTPLSVCGEMAGEPEGALFLAGAGYRTLSMAPVFAPTIKALLRQAKISDLQEIAKEAARCKTSSESRNLLEQAADSYWKGMVRGVADGPTPRLEKELG